MKNSIYLLAVALLMTVFSCENSVDNKLLVGSWTASEFLENDTPKDVDLQSINFQFYDDNTYAFQGLMNKEAGYYHLKNGLLYSTDTLTNDQIEKSVKVIKISVDSLFFEMNSGGIKQIIKLYKTE